MLLEIQKITLDPRFQIRESADLDPANLARLRAAMSKGEIAEWPTHMKAALAVELDGSLCLVDGFHRLQAAKDLRIQEIMVDVLIPPAGEDPVEFAMEKACVANTEHGLPLAPGDMAKAILALIGLAKHKETSGRGIARILSCSPSTVSDTLKKAGIVRDTVTAVRGDHTYKAPVKQNRQDPKDAGDGAAATGGEAPEDGANAVLTPEDPGYEAPGTPQANDPEVGTANSSRWFTMEKWMELFRAVLGGHIDLDPFSEEEANQLVKAARIIPEAEDGFTAPWVLDPKKKITVYVNHPYRRSPEAAQKLLTEWMTGGIGDMLMLCPGTVEQAYFQMLLEAADAVFFPAGRLNFWIPGGGEGKFSPAFGSAVFYFGPNLDRMRKILAPHGVVMVTADSKEGKAKPLPTSVPSLKKGSGKAAPPASESPKPVPPAKGSGKAPKPDAKGKDTAKTPKAPSKGTQTPKKKGEERPGDAAATASLMGDVKKLAAKSKGSQAEPEAGDKVIGFSKSAQTSKKGAKPKK